MKPTRLRRARFSKPSSRKRWTVTGIQGGQPFRDVGGDYFDVIEVAGGRKLFVVADVSGKGMAAALLAANIQALVRNIADTETDPLAFASQINQTCVTTLRPTDLPPLFFSSLNSATGELTYVNAGHNAPMVLSSASTKLLEATGKPLGLFAKGEYEVGKSVIPGGGALLLFTDGLTDSIRGINPEAGLRSAFCDDSRKTMSNLKSLVDPKFNHDDVTILLLKRAAA